MVKIKGDITEIKNVMKNLTIDSTTEVDEAITYITKDAFLIPPNEPPLVSLEQIRDKIIQDRESNVVSIKGKTLGIEVSRSKDLAWCIGEYSINYVTRQVNGYYLSLFKKIEGKWRMAGHTWSEIPSN